MASALSTGSHLFACSIPPSNLHCTDPFRNGNEYPRAFIVRVNAAVPTPTTISSPTSIESNTLTAADVFRFIQDRFAPHKWLTGGVYFLDAIPRIPSGKLEKKRLPVIDVELKARM